jgi:hypothetical protein
MKQDEKQRLTLLARAALARITGGHAKMREHAQRAAAKYSPTNAGQYRTLSELVWWLIAADSGAEAMGVLDALCEVKDTYYWMPHALASSFATRAWFHGKQKNAAAARRDARSALEWVRRDPNGRAIRVTEVRGALARFDEWVTRAATEKGTLIALGVLSHAMRVLVMYQQFGKAGDPAVKRVGAREFTTRLDSGVRELRQRIESW